MSKLDTTIYSSKTLETPAVSKLGHTGWKLPSAGGEPIEMVCVRKPGTVDLVWIPSASHKIQIRENKERNREHFRRNPGLLALKRREKRNSNQYSRGIHC